MKLGIDDNIEFVPITIAILIVSDTRTLETDTSGATLQDRIKTAGHNVFERRIVKDDIQSIRAIVNGKVAAETQTITNVDTIAFFPPVGGG